MSKIKNPLSVFLGGVLQDMRKNEGAGTDEIAVSLKITSSAYRMIESGNANLNLSKLLQLLEIPIFHTIRYEKVSKLLIGTQVLEPNRYDKTEMVKAIRELCTIDEEFKTIFNEEKYPLDELFSNEEILSEFYSDNDIIVSTKKYLERAFNLNTQTLKKELNDIGAKSLCVLQPVIERSLNQFRKSIEEISEINTLQIEISTLKRDINQLKEIQLGYLKHNALTWRNKHKFSFLTGILHEYSNLADENILLQFRDNLTQLWNPQFESLVYLAISKNKTDVSKVWVEYQKILKKVYKENISKGDSNLSFEEGFGKVKMGFVSPDSRTLEIMGIQESDKELWLYKDKQYNYGFKTDYIPDVKGIRVPEFVILTTEETMFQFEYFDKIMNEVEFINKKTKQ